MGKNIDKRVWGVLGKQQTYYSPQKQVEGKTKTSLNANAFDSWDAKRSRFKRIDGYNVSDAAQQGGTVIGQSTSAPVASPTPTPTITQTNTPTPSFTPTQTQTNTPTPTLTPSSTPFNLPSTPDLWYDATNVGSIDYITSGGTDYVSGWRSIGTYNKTLTGTTTDTMPVWSASTLFPGNPKIIRFNKSATTGLRDFLTQRFDSTVITGAGITIFTVIAKPSILDYTTAVGILGFGLQFNLYSGNTTTGGFTPISFTPPRNINQAIGSGNNTISFQSQNSGITLTNTYAFSATNLNDKFLLTQAVPFPTGNPYVEINQSATTLTNAITGTPVTTFNSFNLGATVVSGGTLTASNSGCELAEIMIYTRELTVQEQEAVQNYLRDKWRYDEWASPVPTPTQTASPTTTPTQTITPSRPASGTTEANTYLSAVVDAGGTGITSTVSGATRTLFTSLVSNGLYDKMLAFYPMLGGNSSGCKFNAKNPVDTNAGYRLVFNGGWTFNASGATSNGTNAYADTFLSGGTITARNNHLSVYMLNENVFTGTGKNWIGVSQPGAPSSYFSIGQDGTPRYFYGPEIHAGITSTVAPLSSGLNLISTTGLTQQNLYRNGVVRHTASANGDGTTNASVVIGALNNNNSIIQYYDNTYSFTTIGLGLSDVEQSTLSTIINTFQTSLTRNTY
jgi:hypothetical protein